MSKLLLNSTIGKLYDDKIVIHNNRFFYDRIVSMNMEEQVNYKINLVFLLTSIFFFALAQMKMTDFIFFYFFLFLCSIALVLSAMYRRKDYFLIFSFSMGEQLEFKIKSKSKEEVKHFLEAALEAKKRTPEKRKTLE
jgi:hypothetical protein